MIEFGLAKDNIVAIQAPDRLGFGSFSHWPRSFPQVSPLPPLLEQCAIAEALSDADALIESLNQLLAKKRQLKQGAMQEIAHRQEASAGVRWGVGDV